MHPPSKLLSLVLITLASLLKKPTAGFLHSATSSVSFLQNHITSTPTTTGITSSTRYRTPFQWIPKMNKGHNDHDHNIQYVDDEHLFLSIIEKKARSINESPFPKTTTTTTTTTEYNYKGAGVPRSNLKPDEIVPLLMNALKHNDVPYANAGLESMWEFAGDTTKFVFQNNITDFIESCHQTADEFPTSFYGAAINGQSWDLEAELNLVGGNEGWIATHVMKTISSDGRLRRWQWELRKNRRPPSLGCWTVEMIGSSDRNGDFEATDRGNGWSD